MYRDLFQFNRISFVLKRRASCPIPCPDPTHFSSYSFPFFTPVFFFHSFFSMRGCMHIVLDVVRLNCLYSRIIIPNLTTGTRQENVTKHSYLVYFHVRSRSIASREIRVPSGKALFRTPQPFLFPSTFTFLFSFLFTQLTFLTRAA